MLKTQIPPAVHNPGAPTLDQPILVTIKRDLSNIATKLRFAMMPSRDEVARRELRNWDLWGPFMLCMLLSTTLALRAKGDAETIVTSVFIIMWLGSAAVWLNASFLGSNMTFFQSVTLLGYCLFPLNIVSALTWMVGFTFSPTLKLLLVVVSFGWSTQSSTSFIAQLVPQPKRKLALYPVGLFYLFLSWFVLVI